MAYAQPAQGARTARGALESVSGSSADSLDLDFVPDNYTPDAAGAGVSNADDLAAHLEGIDDALAAVSSSAAARRVIYPLSLPMAIPEGASTYFFTGDVASSSVPIILGRDVTLTKVSVGVNEVDPVRDYAIEVIINDVVEATIPLTAGV